MAPADYPATPASLAQRTARSRTLASRYARVGATSPLSVCAGWWHQSVCEALVRHAQAPRTALTLRRATGSAFGHRLFSYPLASAARLPFGAGRGPRPNAPRSPTATAYRHRPVWSSHPTTRLASHRAGRSFNRQRSRVGSPAPGIWRRALAGQPTPLLSSGMGRWPQSVCAARLRHAQGLKRYIASAPQVSFSALRAVGRRDPAAFVWQCSPAEAQSCQFPRPQEGAARQLRGNRPHCFRFVQVVGLNQLARRCTAIPSPMVSARLRIVLAGQRGIRCSCGTRTLRAPAAPPFGFT